MKSSRLEQIGAAGGIVFVVLEMVAQALVRIGGAEPPFDAPAQIGLFYIWLMVISVVLTGRARVSEPNV